MFYVKKNQNLITPYIVLAFLALSAIILIVGVDRFATAQTDLDPAGEQQLIRKYAVQCYASEGAYPPNLDYLVGNYGLILDPDKYAYYYSAFSSNMMPEVIVTRSVALKEEMLHKGDDNEE